MVWWVKPIVVNILEWVFAGITTAFFLLRLYIRYHAAHRQSTHFRFKLNDLILTITLLCFYIANLADTITIVLIDGVDRMNLSPDRQNELSAYALMQPHKLRVLLKVLFASLFPYYGSWWGVKFYVLMLYYKLVEPMTLPFHRLALHALSLLIIMTCLLWVCLHIFWCHPVSENWNVNATLGDYCVAYFSRIPFLVTMSMHAGTELLLFAFPFSFLYVIKRINKRRFYEVTAMFAVGFIGVLISLGKIVYALTSDDLPIIGFINAWGALEQGFGIVVCCLPAFKALLRRRHGSASVGTSSELVERTFSSNGDPENQGRSVGSSDPSGCGSGSWNRSVTDRQSVILRVDSFERMESVREAAEAKSENGSEVVPRFE